MAQAEHSRHPVALITGAGSGIGRAVARRLSEEGYAVALVGRRAGPLKETGAGLKTPWAAIAADVADPKDAAGIVDRTVERFGRLDVLINNAGYGPPAAIADTTAEMVRAVFDVNAVGPAITIARAWPVMEKSARAGGRCVVVNVSSMATIDPFPTLYAYAAAKAAVNLMARSCHNAGRAIEGGGSIRAFAVAPGAVETEMLRGIVSRDEFPTEKTLAPEAVAEVIAACVRGDRDDQSGEVIVVPSP